MSLPRDSKVYIAGHQGMVGRAIWRAMEEAGRARRGYFVAGLGATQFAVPGAEDRLRLAAREEDARGVVWLAATDPANPFGAALPWPAGAGGRPARSAGAEGALEGEILATPRGDGGFGYDPLFRPLESKQTLAEMTPDEKNRISHRQRALNAIRPRLLELL